jgi:hypothetical protein
MSERVVKFRFKSIRVKKFDLKPNQPDYHNIIELNGKYFTLTGWLGGMDSDISYVLELITEDRLKDKYLRSEFANFLLQRKNTDKG